MRPKIFLARLVAILAVIFAIAASAALAQPAFTYNDFPNLGDADTTMTGGQVMVKADVEATGNGHTWDFSMLAYLPNFRQVVTYRPPQASSSAPFVDATIEEYGMGVNGETVWIFRTSNDTLYRIRQGDNVNGAIYIPNYPDIVFPMSFGQVYQHSQTQNIGNPPVSPAWVRTSRVEYDGYGTLKLPWGTYTDVFRLKWYEVDSAIAVPNKNVYNSYFWYRRGGGVPLFRALWNVDLDATTAIYTTWASRAHAGAASVSEAQTERFEIYPNPARDVVHLGDAPADEVEIVDLVGRSVIRQLDVSGAIDVSMLATGSYFMRITSGGATQQRMFVKE